MSRPLTIGEREKLKKVKPLARKRSRSPVAKPSADRFKDLDKREPLAAAVALVRAFVWSESREGFDYWHAIHLRLCQIAGDDQMYGFRSTAAEGQAEAHPAAAPATEHPSSLSRDTEMEQIIRGFLSCAEIADCAPEDKDPETDELERRARRALKDVRPDAAGEKQGDRSTT